MPAVLVNSAECDAFFAELADVMKFSGVSMTLNLNLKIAMRYEVIFRYTLCVLVYRIIAVEKKKKKSKFTTSSPLAYSEKIIS